jgi:hypothetical protein
MTVATIAGVRFTTTEDLFETDDTGFFDIDVTAEWVTPGPEVPGAAFAAPDHTYIWVDTDAHHVRLPDLSEGTADRSWQLRQAAPIVTAAFGKLTLHASAVNHNGTVVAFIGATGVGKTTLAWELSKAGMPAVADDLLPIRFSEDPYVPLPDTPGPDDSLPLGAMCFLSRDADTLSITALDAGTALQHHINNGFGEHGDTATWAFQFDGYHRIAESTPHVELVIPDDRARLTEVTKTLTDELEGVVR